MIFKKSAGLIIYKKENEILRFLLLESESISTKVKKTIWSLSKGGVEEGETEIEAAVREAKEETGLTSFEIKTEKKFRERYLYKEGSEFVSKSAVYFPALLLDEKDIKLSEEHINYKWCTLSEALEVIKIKAIKEMLIECDKYVRDSEMLIKML